MPVTARWVYLDHAAVAPIPAPAQQAIAHWADEAAHDGATRWPEWDRRVHEVRGLAARLIATDEDEIALVHNTTAGISLVAEGFPWQSGDNVVTLANEFPSNLYPWMNLASRGVETRRVAVDRGRVDVDRIAEACDERTRIVAASWVGFASGWRNDVAQLARVAHDNGALLFLDAIQGLGVFPLDVRATNVDFLAADGHKWLLGPEGAGILFIRREHLDRLRPLGVGWHSVGHDHDFDRIEPDWKPSAARYEGGSENTPGFIGLRASLQLLLAYGAGNHRFCLQTAYGCWRNDRKYP
jgi:selenocysteine lyase/cysteine desulfurase